MKISFKLIVFVALSLCLLQCKSPSNGTEKSSKKNTEIEVCVGDCFPFPWFYNILGESNLKGPVKKVVLRHYYDTPREDEFGQITNVRDSMHIIVTNYNDRGSIITRKEIDATDDAVLILEEYVYDEYGNIVELNVDDYYEGGRKFIVDRDKYGRRIKSKSSMGTWKYYYQGCNVTRIETYKKYDLQESLEFRYDSSGNVQEIYQDDTLFQTCDYDDQGNVILTFQSSLNEDAAVNVYNKLGDPLSLERSFDFDLPTGPISFKYSDYDHYGNWTFKEDRDDYGLFWLREIEYYE